MNTILIHARLRARTLAARNRFLNFLRMLLTVVLEGRQHA
jgi:hypothetical protein